MGFFSWRSVPPSCAFVTTASLGVLLVVQSAVLPHEVEAGPHDVAGRGSGLVAAPEQVTVDRGQTRNVELVASSSTATITIGTSAAH